MSRPDDPTGARSLHGEKRAELEWLLARERDPAAPPPSPEVAAEYAELEDLLASLPSGDSDQSWQDEVFRAAAALARSPRPWWRTTAFRWAMGGAIATAAAVAVWLLIPRAPALEIAVRHTSTTRSADRAGAVGRASDEAVIGDQLVVTARPREAGDLRVYRSGRTLVARCPNDPRCRSGAHGELTIEIPLDAPVPYQVILVDGANIAPSEGATDVNVYLEAARTANARSIAYRTIDVH